MPAATSLGAQQDNTQTRHQANLRLDQTFPRFGGDPYLARTHPTATLLSDGERLQIVRLQSLVLRSSFSSVLEAEVFEL